MEFLSAIEYAERDYKGAVNHVNHAKGLPLDETTQRQLYGLWCYVQKGPPPLTPPSPFSSPQQRLQFAAWSESASEVSCREEAMALYLRVVTEHDPEWRDHESSHEEANSSTDIPDHIKAQLQASGINLIESSSASSSSEDDEDEDEDEDDTTMNLVVPVVKNIFEAVRVGQRYAMFLPLHCNDVDPDTGVSVLSLAVDAEQADAVDAMLSSGADCLWRDEEDGSTALHCAALMGHVRICQALLRAGAKTDAIDDEGMTPLQVAEQEGHGAELLELLQQRR